MATDPKFVEIVTGLLEKSKSGRASWVPGPNENEFDLKLANAMLRIALESPRAAPDFFSLSLFNGEGKRVSAWEVNEGDEGWTTALSLHSLVHRQVKGWGKALEEVEKFIHG
jgi:hypothetical protein